MESREAMELDTSLAYLLAVVRHNPPARGRTQGHEARQKALHVAILVCVSSHNGRPPAANHHLKALGCFCF